MKWVLLAVVVGCSSVGDLMNTRGMKQLGEIHDFRPRAWLHSLGRALGNRSIMLALASMTVAFFSFMALVSTADLSFAVPATAATYMLDTLGAKFFLRERISLQRWIGSLMVMAGVTLISL